MEDVSLTKSQPTHQQTNKQTNKQQRMGSIQSENTAMVFYDSIINRLWNFFHQSRYHCDRRPIEGRWEATWPGFTGFYRVFSLSHFISSTFCAKLKLIGRSPHEITGFLPSFVMRKHFPKKHLTGFYRVFFFKSWPQQEDTFRQFTEFYRVYMR